MMLGTKRRVGVAMNVSTKLEGRPLTRDEERRIFAHGSGGWVAEPPLASRSNTTLNSARVEGFVALFVAGMLGGIAAVLIGHFVL
jgi:hypothetical protein